MDELLEQFLIEGRDLVAEAHRALSVLHETPGDVGALDILFRATHTLKGSVALFEMQPAEALLHAAETVLAESKREGGGFEEAIHDVLLAIVDQVDRWIDVMERDGALPANAAEIAQPLMLAIAEEETGPATVVQADWLEPLLARPQFEGGAPEQGGCAFRYTPDPNCFFRGEDPLATIAAVPHLIAFAILPRDSWPAIDEMDPFRCAAIIEGLSGAEVETVRAAFRLVPDQVDLAPLAAARNEQAVLEVGTVTATTLRVEGAKLDLLSRQAGELAVAIHDLDILSRRAEAVDRAFAADLRRTQTQIERASGALRGSITDVRLVSLAPVLRRLPRLARELAGTLHKDIAFSMIGDSAKADKQIADTLFEPLLHLVRNAIDHGIEAPDERMAQGKPVRGNIILTIAPHGDRILVTLSDDGRGIDPERVRARAVSKGFITAEAADLLSDGQAVRLIFEAGLSTAAQLSEVSGRGVGMDAVLKAIERLQGTVDIESKLGSGTTIRLSLPMNAITTPLLTVRSGGEIYGLRVDQITETLRMEASLIQPVGQGQACVVRDRTVPVVDLAALLGHAGPTSDVARLIITEVTGEPIALRVNALGGRLEAMVRERGGLLSAVPAVGGTAMLGDGGVLLVLDLPGLLS